jgi:uncharacterized protein (DUF1778 family)
MNHRGDMKTTSLRIPAEDLVLIRSAAMLEGKPMGEFLRLAGLERADELKRQREEES